MEPFSYITLAASITTVINNIGRQVMTIKVLCDQVKTADVYLISLVTQLNSIKAALTQIQNLIQSAEYDYQLQTDLELALQASQLHMDFIETILAKFKTKNAASALKFRSKVRVVWETDTLNPCLERLNHQATALNLLITVLTSKSVNEQKQMLQRSNTRKVFKQIQEDNKTLLDDSASMHVLRDQDSVRQAYLRTKSEPVISKSPWKKFTFDHQLFGTKAYGVKPDRTESEKGGAEESVVEVDEDEVEDAETLVDGSTLRGSLTLEAMPDENMYDEKCKATPPFSRMVAFSHSHDDVSHLVETAQQLWNTDSMQPPWPRATGRSPQSHRLSTRYFDLSINSLTLDELQASAVKEDFFGGYKDVASILFAVNLRVYHYDTRRLENDLRLFSRVVNDYDLFLAKILLYLDTTDLDHYSAQSISKDIEDRFMQAGRSGASGDRIHVIVGQRDEMAAGSIFAVSNESQSVKANKWAGLTKSPTM